MTKRMTNTESAQQWAKEQSTATLQEWAAKMTWSNKAKANMSNMWKEMACAAKHELMER
jgi:hypothetical protein